MPDVLNRGDNPEKVDFTTLKLHEKQEVVLAILSACEDQWGRECFAAADAGDNRLYDLQQIADWIQRLP